MSSDSKIILKAEALDGYLTESDQTYLREMDSLYEKAVASFKILDGGGFSTASAGREDRLPAMVVRISA